MNKLSGEIALPASATLAESILYYGMMQHREVTLVGTGGIAVPNGVIDFAASVGYKLQVSDNEVRLIKVAEPKSNGQPIVSNGKKEFFRRLLVTARMKTEAALQMPSCIDGDFEIESILYRRMGLNCELIDDERLHLCRPVTTPTSVMKYQFSKKNYYLIEPLVSGAMATGCKVELLSPVEVECSPWNFFPSLGIKVELCVDDKEENELARRLRRRKSNYKKEFRYIVQRSEEPDDVEIRLPGNHLLGLFAAGLAVLTKSSKVKLLNVPNISAVLSAFRMFSKMGAEISLRDVKGESPAHCEVTVETGKLTGKRFVGNAVRAYPEVFCIIASLGMIAGGKTVIRDLPFGSNMWRKRVGYVREILDSCGARVGEIEDGLVVEGGSDLMMTSYLDTGDELCDLLQQMLSLALPHHSTYHNPNGFENSQLFRLYNELTA